MQADIFGRPVSTVNASEGPAFGAALMAAVGVGEFDDLEEATDATLKITRVVEPDSGRNRVYTQLFHMFQELYSQNRGTFSRLVRLASRLHDGP